MHKERLEGYVKKQKAVAACGEMKDKDEKETAHSFLCFLGLKHRSITDSRYFKGKIVVKKSHKTKTEDYNWIRRSLMTVGTALWGSGAMGYGMGGRRALCSR